MINRTALRVTTAVLGLLLVLVGAVDSQAPFQPTATITGLGTLAVAVGFALIGVAIAELWLGRLRRRPLIRVTTPFVTGAVLVVLGAILSLAATRSRSPEFGWTAYAPLSSLTYTPSFLLGILLSAASIGAMVVGAVLLAAAFLTHATSRTGDDR